MLVAISDSFYFVFKALSKFFFKTDEHLLCEPKGDIQASENRYTYSNADDLLVLLRPGGIIKKRVEDYKVGLL